MTTQERDVIRAQRARMTVMELLDVLDEVEAQAKALENCVRELVKMTGGCDHPENWTDNTCAICKYDTNDPDLSPCVGCVDTDDHPNFDFDAAQFTSD